MPLQKAICFLLQPFHLYRDQIHHIQARCFSKFWKSCFASSETCLLSVGLTSGWRSLIVQRRGFPDLQRVHRICKLDHGDIAALFMQVSKGGSNTRWLFNRSFRRGVDNCALKTPNSHSKTFFDWVTYPWVEWLSACGKRWARSMFALWLHWRWLAVITVWPCFEYALHHPPTHVTYTLKKSKGLKVAP